MDENKLGRIESVDIDRIKPHNIRHEKLPDELYQRARKIFELTFEVQPTTFSKFEENFRRDLDPLSEIIIWERITKTYSVFISNNNFILRKKKSIFNFIVLTSLNPFQKNFSDDDLLFEDEKRKLYELYFEDK